MTDHLTIRQCLDLLAFEDGDRPDDVRAGQHDLLSTHVRACTRCRRLLDECRELAGLLAEPELPAPPPAWRSRITDPRTLSDPSVEPVARILRDTAEDRSELAGVRGGAGVNERQLVLSSPPYEIEVTIERRPSGAIEIGGQVLQEDTSGSSSPDLSLWIGHPDRPETDWSQVPLGAHGDFEVTLGRARPFLLEIQLGGRSLRTPSITP